MARNKQISGFVGYVGLMLNIGTSWYWAMLIFILSLRLSPGSQAQARSGFIMFTPNLRNWTIPIMITYLGPVGRAVSHPFVFKLLPSAI